MFVIHLMTSGLIKFKPFLWHTAFLSMDVISFEATQKSWFRVTVFREIQASFINSLILEFGRAKPKDGTFLSSNVWLVEFPRSPWITRRRENSFERTFILWSSF